MATIANLSAKITADCVDFEKKIGRVRKLIDMLQKKPAKQLLKFDAGKITDSASSLAQVTSQLTGIQAAGTGATSIIKDFIGQAAGLSKLGPLGAIAAVAIVAVMLSLGALAMAAHVVHKQMELLLSDFHIANKIGTDVAAIDEMRAALRAVGGDTSIAGKALLDLTHTLAAGATGDIAINDALKRIGLSAGDLIKMRPEQAFRLIADRIRDIGDPAKQAAAAVQIFGDNASELLPILVRGSAALDSAQASLKMFGRGASSFDAAKLKQLTIIFEQIGAAIAGTLANAALQLLPIIITIVDTLAQAAKNSETWVAVMFPIIPLFLNLADVIGGCVYAAILLGAGLDKTMKAMLIVINLVIIAIAQLVEEAFRSAAMLDRLAARVLVGAAKRAALAAAQGLDRYADVVRQKKDELIAETQGLASSIANVLTEVDDLFGKMMRKSQSYGKAASDKINPAALLPANRFKEQFGNGAKEVIEDVSTPLERFQSKMMRLNFLIKSGAISWDTYSRSAANAVEELESAHQLANLALPNPLRAQSVEAASAINKANMQEQMRFRESPQDRVNRILTQSQQIELQQLDQQRKIADGVQNNRVVRF